MNAAIQLDLFSVLADAETVVSTWQYHCGLPDRSGIAAFTHLIRHPSDAQRESREARHERHDDVSEAAAEWKVTVGGKVEEWSSRIEKLLRDGEPRTFNAIVLTLTDGRLTADLAGDKPPDKALWKLVEAGTVWWACELGVVWFLHRDCIEIESEAA